LSRFGQEAVLTVAAPDLPVGTLRIGQLACGTIGSAT
jgi:hypothetical protein